MRPVHSKRRAGGACGGSCARKERLKGAGSKAGHKRGLNADPSRQARVQELSDGLGGQGGGWRGAYRALFE